jgi:flavin reductase (DIM6/NTAB) family NADH-FMN oxidoreductase RutF
MCILLLVEKNETLKELDFMGKVTIEKNLFGFPWVQTILGTHLKGKANFMALDWLTRTNYNPPLLGVCVNKVNASCGAVIDTGEFSVNLPSEDMLEVTDYVGIVSGKSVDKSDLFELFYGELKHAPMISKCKLTMECKVTNTVELPTNYFFIGEIINIFVDEDALSDGKPDIKTIKPFVLTMPDNRYWSIGEVIGKAWDAGKSLKKL